MIEILISLVGRNDEITQLQCMMKHAEVSTIVDPKQ